MTAIEINDPFTPDATSSWYRSMPNYWHAVSYSSDLGEGEMASVRLLSQRVMIVRRDGMVRAFSDVCRHKGAAVSLGWFTDDCITCPYHGWQYDLDGKVARVPARPELDGVLDAGLARYHCLERSGLIWVCLVDEPWGEPIDIPEWSDDEMKWQSPPFYDWATSSPRRLENFVDFSHFPWVHENILGTRDRPEVEEVDVRREGKILRFDRHVVEPNEPYMKQLIGLDDDLITVENRYFLPLPSTIYLLRVFPNGKRYALLMSSSPTGPATCRNFWHIGSDFALDAEGMNYLLDFELRVLDQDQPIVESQVPEHLPDQLGAEMYVKVADEVTLSYRRWLLELARQFDT